MKTMTKVDKEIEVLVQKLRKLSNSDRCHEAYLLAKKMRKKFPNSLRLLYHEAVMYGDDETARTPKATAKHHRKAMQMLKPLMRRLRNKQITARARQSIRNEYYWFSHQPL